MLNINRNKLIDRAITVLGKAKAKPKPPIFAEIEALLADPDVDLDTKVKVLNKAANLISKETSHA